jgi:dGTPase
MTIARYIGANLDLVYAISLAHDLGHTPFGHAGEENIIEIGKKLSGDANYEFSHEEHGLRVIDKLAKLPGKRTTGLNLTFEVRDGVFSHCGENPDSSLTPDFNKKNLPDSGKKSPDTRPATLEGCIVRFADKIAYLGRDIEDAITAGLLKEHNNQNEMQKLKLFFGELTNKAVVTRLSVNLIENNLKNPNNGLLHYDSDHYEHLQALFHFNNKYIYNDDRLNDYKDFIKHVMEILFNEVISHIEERRITDLFTTRDTGVSNVWQVLHQFCQDTYLSDKLPPSFDVAVDFIAGMTDNYAITTYNDLVIPKGII